MCKLTHWTVWIEVGFLEVIITSVRHIELYRVITSSDSLNIKLYVVVLLYGSDIVKVNDGEAVNEYTAASDEQTDNFSSSIQLLWNLASNLNKESTLLIALILNVLFGRLKRSQKELSIPAYLFLDTFFEFDDTR